MNKSVPIIFMAVGLLFSFFIRGNAFAGTDEVRRITGEDLKSILNDPLTIVIDVRQNWDWQQSDRKIRGAAREDPMQEEASWAKKYPKDSNIILYCS